MDVLSLFCPTVQKSVRAAGADRILPDVAQAITPFNLPTQGQHLLYIHTSERPGG